MISDLAALLIDRGDVAHLALFLWAASVSGFAVVLVRALAQVTRSYEAFVLAIAKLNALLTSHKGARINSPTDGGQVNQERTL